MCEIIKLKLSDKEEIYELEKTCFPNEYMSDEIFTEMFCDPRTSVYVIKDNGNMASYTCVYNWKGQSDYIKIMTLGTHPDYRKKGYGHKLMSYVIENMMKEEMYKFKSETRETNYKMQKLFEEFGFKVIDKVEDYYDNPNETAFVYFVEK